MKKLLMLTAKVDELNLLLTAKRLGYYVITTGNAPQQPGHRYADKYVPFDYSDYEGLTHLAEDLCVDAVLQGCSDNCALSAAYVCEKLKLPGHDMFVNAEIIHRKDKFKEFAAENNVLSPLALLVGSEEEAFAAIDRIVFPVIVKPTDRAGGQGVMVAHGVSELKMALHESFALSKPGAKVVVERYLQGSLHSLDTFIVGGKVVAYGTANDYSYHNQYMTNTGLFPADGWRNVVKVLIPETERIAKLLSLVDGQLHMQYMVENGKPWIIEMMRRTPGNRFTTALSNSIGLDWDAWVVRAEAGENCRAIPHSHDPQRFYGYQSFMAPGNGIYEGYAIDPTFNPSVFQIEEWKQPGCEVTDFANEKFGNIQYFLEDETAKNTFLRTMNSVVNVVVK